MYSIPITALFIALVGVLAHPMPAAHAESAIFTCDGVPTAYVGPNMEAIRARLLNGVADYDRYNRCVLSGSRKGGWCANSFGNGSIQSATIGAKTAEDAAQTSMQDCLNKGGHPDRCRNTAFRGGQPLADLDKGLTKAKECGKEG